jgi:hypothetical protein
MKQKKNKKTKKRYSRGNLKIKSKRKIKRVRRNTLKKHKAGMGRQHFPRIPTPNPDLNLLEILRSGKVYNLNKIMLSISVKYLSENQTIIYIDPSTSGTETVEMLIGEEVARGAYGRGHRLKLRGVLGDETLPIVVKIIKGKDNSEKFFAETFSKIPIFGQEWGGVSVDELTASRSWDEASFRRDGFFARWISALAGQVVGGPGSSAPTPQELGHLETLAEKFVNCGIVQSFFAIESTVRNNNNRRDVEHSKKVAGQYMLLESGSPGSIVDLNEWLKKSGPEIDLTGVPLPEGWATRESPSTGETYFGNPNTDQSTFDRNDPMIPDVAAAIEAEYSSPRFVEYKRLATKFLWQIVCQMSCLEKYGAFAFDIKPENILINEVDERAFLIDLGGIVYNPAVFYRETAGIFPTDPPNLARTDDESIFVGGERMAVGGLQVAEDGRSMPGFSSSWYPLFIKGAREYGLPRPSSLNEAKAFNLLAVSLLATSFVIRRGYPLLYWRHAMSHDQIPPETEKEELLRLATKFETKTIIPLLIDLFVKHNDLFRNPPSSSNKNAAEKIISGYGRLGTLDSIAKAIVTHNPEIL